MAARTMPSLTDSDDDRSTRILAAFWGDGPGEAHLGTVLPMRPLARAVRHATPVFEESSR